MRVRLERPSIVGDHAPGIAVAEPGGEIEGRGAVRGAFLIGGQDLKRRALGPVEQAVTGGDGERGESCGGAGGDGGDDDGREEGKHQDKAAYPSSHDTPM